MWFMSRENKPYTSKTCQCVFIFEVTPLLIIKSNECLKYYTQNSLPHPKKKNNNCINIGKDIRRGNRNT